MPDTNSTPHPGPPIDPNAAFLQRYGKARFKLAIGVLGAGLILAGATWFKNKFLTIDPGKGTPVGLSVRTDTYIATLIQSLVPYTPSLHRDASKDRYTLSVLLTPVDGSAPELIPVPGELRASAFGLAKFLGSDGRVLWFSVDDIGGVDLKKLKLADAEGFNRNAPLTSSVTPRKEAFLSAGAFVTPTSWMGLYSPSEAAKYLKPKTWLDQVVNTNDAKEKRVLQKATLDPIAGGGHHAVLSVEPIGDAEYLNAAFIRMDDNSGPIRLASPDGFLMLFTSKPGLGGTAVIARVDGQGNVIWKTDTGIYRFSLGQILPGERSVAFIGTRPQVEGKVSEPLLVVVDNATGKATTTSLWR